MVAAVDAKREKGSRGPRAEGEEGRFLPTLSPFCRTSISDVDGRRGTCGPANCHPQQIQTPLTPSPQARPAKPRLTPNF